MQTDGSLERIFARYVGDKLAKKCFWIRLQFALQINSFISAALGVHLRFQVKKRYCQLFCC